jgi:hypothetical protein
LRHTHRGREDGTGLEATALVPERRIKPPAAWK